MQSRFATNAGILDGSSRPLLAALRDHGTLLVMRPGNGHRGTILVFPNLLNIAEGKQAF